MNTYRITPSVEKTPLLMPDSINMFVSMPCPLKIPFRQLFQSFTEENSANGKMPVYCPVLSHTHDDEVEQMFQNAASENDLPDIIIMMDLKRLFRTGFYDRFIKTGIYRGVTSPAGLAAMPEEMQKRMERHNLGALSFITWSVVTDLTAGSAAPDITSWKQLLHPAFEKSLTVHGHADKISFGMLYFFYSLMGEEGVVHYAGNIREIRHFSQIIKRLGAAASDKTRFNFLPDVAAVHIPSNKKIAVPEMEEGKDLGLFFCLVKESGMNVCKPVLDFLHGEAFSSMLRRGGCVLPEETSHSGKYIFMNLDAVIPNYMELEKKLEGLYMQHLHLPEELSETSMCC
ncbi:MAG: ABC transporter substrate-binding protein [Bacteroidales bacterium]|jgi:hypothetical protein|nr:ABC transporter substrate-binding protein [Bacteroidales bacterium]